MSRRILLGVGLLAGIGLTWLVGAGWGPNRVAGQQGHTPSPPSAAGELSTAPTAQDIAALDRTPPPLEGYSPIQICLSPDSRTAYVVNQTADSISVLDVASRAVQREIPVGRHPTHAVIAPDGQKLYVTCHYDYVVQELDLRTGQVVRQLPTGLEPTGLALSQDGRRLSVANTLSDSVTLLDLEQGVVRAETPVGRVPRYLAETADGRRLVVGEAHGRSVTILDPASGTVLESRTLGRSSQLRHVLCTPDGRWAITTLLVGHDEMVTVQMERGWINSNGFGVLDLQQPGHYVLLLLDEVLRGATNPWGLALSGDQQWLYVTLAGIHEVAIVDLPAVLELVSQTTPDQVPRLSQNVEILQQQQLARRVDVGGLGPRGLAWCESTGELWVANYFSDDLSILDATSGELRQVVPLGPRRPRSLWREGEMRFNDGRICYQNWQSCASCHQEDATIDSLNWDLINDGMGNPKNAKSMHDGILTPPAMWSGVRGNQDVAVMAGQRFLGFLPDPEIQQALMEYIGKPRRARNPYRQADPELLARGQQIFYRARCDMCHIPPHYADLKTHDIGLTGYTSEVDFRSRFDTPSLLECYRTAPYLHDGRAATLREIFTEHNAHNMHGLTRGLSPKELDELIAFVRSL